MGSDMRGGSSCRDRTPARRRRRDEWMRATSRICSECLHRRAVDDGVAEAGAPPQRRIVAAPREAAHGHLRFAVARLDHGVLPAKAPPFPPLHALRAARVFELHHAVPSPKEESVFVEAHRRRRQVARQRQRARRQAIAPPSDVAPKAASHRGRVVQVEPLLHVREEVVVLS